MVNKLSAYLVSQIFQVGALAYIARQIYPARIGTIEAEQRESLGLMPGSHAGMDAICVIALINGFLVLLLYKEIKFRYRVGMLVIWMLLALITNPAFR